MRSCLILKKTLRLVKEQKAELFPSLLVGIGLRTAFIIWRNIRGKVMFTQKLVSAPTLLNSRKDRQKDGFFLWDVEELTFLINTNLFPHFLILTTATFVSNFWFVGVLIIFNIIYLKLNRAGLITQLSL